MKTSILPRVIEACERAGRSLVHDFGEVENLQVSRKGPSDFVSVADKQSEEILREYLLRIEPEAGFLGEESEEEKGSGGGRWIVDPLDGTTNFLHGLPHFAISVAYEREGEVELGVVYQPVTGEIFRAERGKGAYLGRQRLRVSGREDLEFALFEAGLRGKGRVMNLWYSLPSTVPLRSQGSAALGLAYVASGRLDACWWSGVKLWDVAAGLILVREAGGFVLNFEGKAYEKEEESILATNMGMKSTLTSLLV